MLNGLTTVIVVVRCARVIKDTVVTTAYAVKLLLLFVVVFDNVRRWDSHACYLVFLPCCLNKALGYTW